jgi:L-alanine-DL-glutamate epimerase-like enolase superfamily enzyme
MVRVRTDVGLTGLGEASDAFGFANTTKQDAARMESELRRFVRRGEKYILDPPERIENGMIRIMNRSGFGVELNEKVVRAHSCD